jgi:hypothetical protein
MGTDAEPMTSQPSCRWATAREARDHLGVSEVTLARWRKSGLLRAGRDWRRKFPSANSPVLYHLDACESTMSEATARSVDQLEPLISPSFPRGGRRGAGSQGRRGTPTRPQPGGHG